MSVYSVVRLSLPLRVLSGVVAVTMFAAAMGCMGWRAYANEGLRGAALDGQAQQVVYWLGRGADVDARDAYGDTPLMYAARGAHPGVVQILLARGANVRLRDDYGMSPLRWATFHARDSRTLRGVDGLEIRQVPRPDALQTLALLCR